MAIENRILKILPEFLEKRGITLDFLLGMQELGIVAGVDSVGLEANFFSADSTSFVRALRCNGKALVIRHEDPKKLIKLPAYLVTSIGAQILALGSFAPDTEYLTQTGKWIAKEGFKVMVVDWTQVTERDGTYSNAYSIDNDSAGEAVKK